MELSGNKPLQREIPSVQEGDWIVIGRPGQATGVISSIYSTRPNVVEIVHLNKGNRPLYEDVQWSGSTWEYTNTAVSPGFSKLQRRLQPYVAILLAGKPDQTSEEAANIGALDLQED